MNLIDLHASESYVHVETSNLLSKNIAHKSKPEIQQLKRKKAFPKLMNCTIRLLGQVHVIQT